MKRWRIVIHPLSGATPQQERELEANNWMGALRAVRQQLGEDGGVPAGASCAVAPDGTVTILDAAVRRKFLITPLGPSYQPQSSARAEEAAKVAIPAAQLPSGVTATATEPASPAQASPTAPQPAAAPAPNNNDLERGAQSKKPKFQTVAYMPGMEPGAAAAEAKPARSVMSSIVSSTPVPGTQQAVVVPTAQAAAPAKKKKFETVAFSAAESQALHAKVIGVAESTTHSAPEAAPSSERGSAGVTASDAVASPQAAAASPATEPATAATSDAASASAATPTETSPDTDAATPARASLAPGFVSASGRPLAKLELLFTRDEEPSAQNPLTYRERAYLIPRGMRITDAEAALRFMLSDLQAQTAAAPRGKFINLAAFDHRWTDEPVRPPLIVLEWRDWRGEPIVDYPAAAQNEPLELEERLALVFEALHELAHLRSAAEGLEFAVQLLLDTVPSAAVSTCLYDINTDELRFVAVTGPGADVLRGTAIPRGAGLFGQAARVEHTALVITDVQAHPSFNKATDGRRDLAPVNMLLRPLVRDGHLLGMLQLIDRNSGVFSAEDVHVVNYVADRLAEFLHVVRGRPPSG